MTEPKKRTFCGYLHVKRPQDQRSLIKLSSWRNRLVTVLLDEEREDNERTNVVRILLGKKQASLVQKANTNNRSNESASLKKKFNRTSRNRLVLKSNNCVIYRCKSRKEKHAFVLANQTRPLLYLAASNEVLCQHWIRTIREALWCPHAQQAALDSEKKIFPVSLVDNEYSFRANLVGIFGYLCFDLPHKLVLRNSQDATLIQDWALNTVSMRLVGEAVQESFALIERVSLNNEHVFVEVNSDFIPNHADKENENAKRLSEHIPTDCNLILMNCSMDSMTGPGLITFYCENAAKLIKEFKIQKQKDLAELRLKRQQQLLNNDYLIEDLIANDHTKQSNYDDNFNDDLNERLNEILTRKLSNPLIDFSSDETTAQNESSSNLKALIELKDQNDFDTDFDKHFDPNFDRSFDRSFDRNFIESFENLNSPLEQPKNKNKMQLNHKLQFYSSVSELLDPSMDNIDQNLEDSLDSLKAVKCKLNAKNEKQNQTKEFESSLSSSSSED